MSACLCAYPNLLFTCVSVPPRIAFFNIQIHSPPSTLLSNFHLFNFDFAVSAFLVQYPRLLLASCVLFILFSTPLSLLMNSSIVEKFVQIQMLIFSKEV